MSFNNHNIEILKFWNSDDYKNSAPAHENAKLELIECKSCGSSLPLSGLSAIEKIICPYCSSGRTNKFNNQNKNYLSFIRLGMKCRFFDKSYTVLGRAIYQQDYQEWDKENKKYSTEQWIYHNWVLHAEDGSLLYLSEDSEGSSVAKKIIPTNPSVPSEGDTKANFFDDSTFKQKLIQEKGTTTINYLEGEFPWEPEAGDKYKFFMYDEDSKRSYSVYIKKDDESKSSDEIEFYEETSLSDLKLAEAFEIELFVKRQKQYSFYKKVMYLNFFLLPILFLLSIFSPYGGEVIFKESLRTSQIPSSGYQTTSIMLDKKEELYEIALSSRPPSNSWAWFGVELISEVDGPVGKIEADFWYEGGESSTNKSQVFKLEKPRRYFLRIFNENSSPSINPTLTLTIREGVFPANGTLLSFFFLLAFTVINLSLMKELIKKHKWEL